MFFRFWCHNLLGYFSFYVSLPKESLFEFLMCLEKNGAFSERLWFIMLSSNIIYTYPSFLSTFNTIFRKLTTEITRHKYLTFLGTKCLIKIMTKYLFYFWKIRGNNQVIHYIHHILSSLFDYFLASPIFSCQSFLCTFCVEWNVAFKIISFSSTFSFQLV